MVKVANEIGCKPVHVALNWVRKRGKTIIPVVGARNAAQVQENLDSLDFDLNENQMKELNEVSEIELGFPHDFLQQEGVEKVLYGGLKDKVQRP